MEIGTGHQQMRHKFMLPPERGSIYIYIISFMITGGISVGDQCPKDHRELPIGCIGQELLAISTLHVPP